MIQKYPDVFLHIFVITSLLVLKYIYDKILIRRYNNIFRKLSGNLGLEFFEIKKKKFLVRNFSFKDFEVLPYLEGNFYNLQTKIYVCFEEISIQFDTIGSIEINLGESYHKDLYVNKNNSYDWLFKKIRKKSYVEVGNPDFDHKFFVRSGDAEYAKRVLKNEVCSLILGMDFKGWLYLKNNKITYTERRMFGNERKMERFKNNLNKIAAIAKQLV